MAGFGMLGLDSLLLPLGGVFMIAHLVFGLTPQVTGMVAVGHPCHLHGARTPVLKERDLLGSDVG